LAVLYLSDLLESTTSGGLTDVARDRNAQHRPLELAGERYAKGLGMSFWRQWERRSAIEWDIASGPWDRLRGKVGLQPAPNAAVLPWQQKDDTRVRFFVRGDGRELFNTGQRRWDSPPVTIDVPIEGVKRLRLEVLNEGGTWVAAVSANWVDLRLEKVAPPSPGWPGYLDGERGIYNGWDDGYR